jgi:hypothetical protein
MPKSIQTTLVKRKDPIPQLLKDRRTKNIHGCEHGYVHDGKIYVGLTRKLKRIFHPQSKINKKKNNSGSSIQNGNRIHRLLYHEYHCTKSEYCDCGIAQPNRNNSFVKNAKKIIESENITIIECEIPIVSENAQTATALDMIGYSNKGKANEKSVIISIKTGYEIGYEKDSKGWMMQGPFKDIKSNSKQHNQLQGFAEYNILKKDYGLTFDEYIILYLAREEDKCKIERSEDWWKEKEKQDSFFTYMKSQK